MTKVTELTTPAPILISSVDDPEFQETIILETNPKAVVFNERFWKLGPPKPGRNKSTLSPTTSLIAALKLKVKEILAPAIGGENDKESVPLNEPTACVYSTLVGSTAPYTATAARVIRVSLTRMPSEGSRGDPLLHGIETFTSAPDEMLDSITKTSCDVEFIQDTLTFTAPVTSAVVLCQLEPLNPARKNVNVSLATSAMFAAKDKEMLAQDPASASLPNPILLDRK